MKVNRGKGKKKNERRQDQWEERQMAQRRDFKFLKKDQI